MISLRLKEIAKYVKGYQTMADIACDHGYLGIYAVKYLGIKECLLTDINPLPLESARKNVEANALNPYFNFALGNGLKPLTKNYDVICIAGIGGCLMRDILIEGLNQLNKTKRLVLAPNTDAYEVRKFLKNNYFIVTNEEMVFDGKYYEIIVAEKTNEIVNYTEEELLFGPILLREKSINFVTFYTKKITNLLSQVQNISNTDSKQNLLNKIAVYEKIIKKL